MTGDNSNKNQHVEKSQYSFKQICEEEDNVRRKIWDVGPVSRDPSSSGHHLWSVTFKSVALRDTSSVIEADFASAELQFARIGSTWEGNRLEQQYSDDHVKTINVDPSSQKLWNIESSSLERQIDLFEYHFERDLPAAIVVDATIASETTQVLIRCSELIRFFLANSKPLITNLFEFLGDGSNPNLYVKRDSGRTDDKTYRFVPSPDLAAMGRVRTAQMISWPSILEAMVLAAGTARRQTVLGLPIWPVFKLPTPGPYGVRAYGKFRHVRVPWSNSPQQMFAVSQLIKCNAQPPFSSVEIELPGELKAKGDKDPGSVSLYGEADASLVFDSRVPPHPQTGYMSVESNPEDEALPGLQSQTVKHIRRESSDSERPAFIHRNPKDSDSVSAMPGTSEDSTSARLETVDNEFLTEADQDGEECLDRPDILTLKVEGSLQPAPTQLFDVPRKLEYLIRAIPLLREAGYQVTPPYSLEFGMAPLVELPMEWGAISASPESPNGRRRALILRVQHGNDGFFFLDIEVHERETRSIGIHVVRFEDEPSISDLQFFAPFIHHRLEKGHWPTEETHSGRFRTSAMRHSEKYPAGPRAVALVLHHVHKIAAVSA